MASQASGTDHERRIHELDQNVERNFDIRKRLGKGAYGIVWKATDKRHNETVALKKIFDAFRDDTDAQRTYREVIFLRAFRHHPNIIRLMDVCKAANNLDFYLVFEFMESDLHNVIKKGDVLKDIHKRFVMYQLINAIKYMHSGNVIHRDLKPSNILIDSKCRLKVADFGLARTLSTKRKSDYDDLEDDAMLTDYVATRWYRAPEILVASRNYTKGIDMWGLGCILGEMIRQKPLFQGTSTVNQIEKIVAALPAVTQQDIESIGLTFGSVLLCKKVHRDRRHSLDEMLRSCSDDAISLVKCLLVLDPHGRLTAKAALKHPYVSRFRTASAEMELRVDIRPPLKDDVRYRVDKYRSTLYDMIGLGSRGSATPSSNRETSASTTTTTTKPQRSMSRTRTYRASQTTQVVVKKKESSHPHQHALEMVNHRNRSTQNWVDQQQQQQQQVIPACSSSLQQPRHRSKEVSRKQPAPVPTPALAPAPAPAPERNLPNNRQNHVALHRELAAVAATAPKKKHHAKWQSQALAQTKFHAEAKAQAQVLLHTQMPLMTPSSEEISNQTERLRSRSLKAREKVQRKERVQDKDRNGDRIGDRNADRNGDRIGDRNGDRNGDQEHKDSQRNTRTTENLWLMKSEREELEVIAYMKAKVKAQALELKKIRELEQETEQKEEQEKSDPNNDIFYTPGHVCYGTTISYLQAEMDNCKRQLVNFVHDNRDVLGHRELRYHLEQLQRKQEELDDELQEELQADQFGQSSSKGGSGEPCYHSYEYFREEQRKQKQLQLQEFLARDETNEFEHPDLASVYKASSICPFARESRESREAKASKQSASQAEQVVTADSNADYPTTSNLAQRLAAQLEKSRISKRLYLEERAAKEQQAALGLHHKAHRCHRHQHLPTPSYDHMRLRHNDIQEADFSRDSSSGSLS